jgi:ribosomal protein S6
MAPMKKAIETEAKESENRIYEVGYVLLSTFPEEKIEAEAARLKKSIESKGGVIIAEEAPYLRDLAYEMIKVIANKNERFTQGYFGWIKFEVGSDEALELKKAFDADMSILRHLLIKTVRENTMYTKRPVKAESKESVLDESGETVEEVPAVVEQVAPVEEPVVA